MTSQPAHEGHPNVSERVLADWDAALDTRPGSLFRPSSSLEDAVTNVTANLLDHRFFDRWTCDNEDCPARPAWDHALDETFGRITANAQESMLEAFRAILIRELEAFAKAHPEAAWREAAPA